MRSLLFAAALGLVLVLAVPAAAAPKTTPCPTFRVLHNNPAAGFKKGTYDMQVWGNVTCQQAVKLFQGYLVNPRSLPRGWKADRVQSAFENGSATGFSLALVKGKTTPTKGGSVDNCPTFQVVKPDPRAGFAAGTYELQVWGTTTCTEASSVFKAYLNDPVNGLPKGWKHVVTPPSFRNGTNGFTVFQP
jgi:hypothetical protein